MTPTAHKVFVYGTLKRGHSNNYLLSQAKFIASGRTRRLFRLYNCGFPVLRPPSGHRDAANAKVMGEVYEVSDETLRRLDLLESEGRMYHRIWVRVQIRKTPGGRGIGCMAYAYLGNAGFVRSHRLRLYAPPAPGEAYNWPCRQMQQAAE